MQLATVRTPHGTAAARRDGADLVLLPYADVGALLRSEPDWRAAAARSGGASIAAVGADFAPTVPHPEKIICVGINYQSHLDEIGFDRPEYPTVFAKFDRALIGANDPIELPAASSCPDWEVELGVIVGRKLRHVSQSEGLDGVAGYTIVNDVTMRDWQFRTPQFLQGKTFERSTPVGPYLVTPDEVDHATNLNMSCEVGGALMQEASTKELLFDVGFLLSYLSTVITLSPGDLIATGTPAGVGAARKPAVYLQPGQILVSEISGLGRQANPCVAMSLGDRR